VAEQVYGILISLSGSQIVSVDVDDVGASIGADSPYPESLLELGGERRILLWMNDNPDGNERFSVLYKGDPIRGDVLVAISENAIPQEPSADEKAKMLEIAEGLNQSRPDASDIANFKRQAGVQLLDSTGAVIFDEPLFDDEGKLR